MATQDEDKNSDWKKAGIWAYEAGKWLLGIVLGAVVKAWLES